MACLSKSLNPSRPNRVSFSCSVFVAAFSLLARSCWAAKKVHDTLTTKGMTQSQVQERLRVYGSIIAATLALLFLLSVSASFYKTGRVSIGHMSIRKGKGIFWKNDVVCCGPEGYGELLETNSRTKKDVMDDAITLQLIQAASVNKPLTNVQKQSLQKIRLKIREQNASFVKGRDFVLKVLLVVYIGASIGIPLLQAQTVSCDHGFFWETHMMFLAVFLLTKVAELFLYAFDPTLDGELDVLSFVCTFVLSFTGYSDGYQDATAIIIAHSCPTHAAQNLAWVMGFTYLVGVVILQWVVVVHFALLDDSRACLMKVLHMDALAACITLPEAQKWTWNLIHMARTFGEDIPQGTEQTWFICTINKNYFMVISILGSVASSFKAVYDACRRPPEAAGAQTKLPGYERKEGAPMKGTPEWNSLRNEILAACGKLPDSPDLSRLKDALQHPHYSDMIDEYTDERGSTPLMFCVGPVNSDTLEMVKELVIGHNANPTATNLSNESAVSFAKAWHNQALEAEGSDPTGAEVLQLLIAYGGDPEASAVF